MKANKPVLASSRRLLKAKEVAEILNVSEPFVYKLMQRGHIQTVKILGVRRVRPDDLERFIENCVLNVGQVVIQ